MNGKKFVCNTVIPSTTAIQRAAAIVQKYGEKRFLYNHGKVEGLGKRIAFETIHAIEAAVWSAGLEGSAKRRRVQLAESVYGAKLSKHLNFVMLGVKNQDLFAMDQETGELVSVKNVQSATNIWPVKIITGKESSSLMQNHLSKVFG